MYTEFEMTAEQKYKCAKIIHAAAATAGAGNLIPVPGVGIAIDTIAITSMAMGLSAVFNANLSEQVAKGLALSAIKSTVLKQPLRVLTKEVSKVIPFLGSAVGAGISVVLLEAAGWALANDMARAARYRSPHQQH
jgi:uncharacterized protein (DUF697 family)